MRTKTSAIDRYTPGSPPNDPRDLSAYLQQEFARVAAMFSVLADGQLERSHVVPVKPRDGMIRYFDGANANPAAGGEGFYGYYAASWKKLG